jgi:F420H(2)-dependent quinone reductase
VSAVPRPPSATRLSLYRRWLNPVMRFMVRMGSGGRGVDHLRVLRVRGRTSGRLYEVPVRVAVLDDHRYVMTMLGDAQWARNLRAAGHGQLVLGRSVEGIAAHELTGPEKAAFLTRCFQYRQFERRGRSTLKSAYGQTVKHLSPADIDLLGQVWFIFRLQAVEPTSGTRLQ